MITHDYDYDLITHPFLSEFIDEDSGILTQSFVIPTQVNEIKGFRVKVSKYGKPGPLFYSIGKTPGGDEIAHGLISSNRILPVFELLIGDDFQPFPVEQGEVYYLNLWVEDGKKMLDAYKVYGPNIGRDAGDDENYKIPYWWKIYTSDDGIELSLRAKYEGSEYADFDGGQRVDTNGKKTWSISFQIFTTLDGPITDAIEQRFEFVKDLLAPPFSEWSKIADDKERPTDNEISIDSSWGVVCDAHESDLLNHLVSETHQFFTRVMDVPLQKAAQEKNINLRLDMKMEIPKGIESFIISVRNNSVELAARDPRGLMRAVHWLEDAMILRRAPILGKGKFEVESRFSLRMVPGIYPPISYFQLQQEQIWTPGYVWRLARAGYNAIYFQANIEELVEDSNIFPEMNHPKASVAIERLRRMTELAESYGVDVYMDIKTGYMEPFSQDAYDRMPEIKSFERHGSYPCSGQQVVLDFYKETLENAFRKTGMKGLVVIYDTEGFYSCFLHGRNQECHYCKDYDITTLANRLFDALKSAIRDVRPDSDLVLWSYFCDAQWNYDLINSLPPDITLMSCFSQFAMIDRFGTKVRTDDYSLVSEEPSDYFLTLKEIARERGIKLYAKTEDTFGQEFVSTPYTPCLTQHQRRWDKIIEEGVDGVMTQYVHHGFMPTPCADLTRQNMVHVTKDGTDILLTGQQKLRNVARMNYSEAMIEDMLAAWENFSTAIRDHFPYAWGVTRYPGPIQAAPALPFLLNPDIKPPRLHSRGFVYNLNWTQIEPRFLVEGVWDAALIQRCFKAMSHYYRLGNKHLESALSKAEPVYRGKIIHDLNISETQLLQIETLVNYIDFIQQRDLYLQEKDSHLLPALATILENEIQSTERALKLCQSDSRIGFSCEGAGNIRGGIFTPLGIQQKLSGLHEALNLVNHWQQEDQ